MRPLKKTDEGFETFSHPEIRLYEQERRELNPQQELFRIRTLLDLPLTRRERARLDHRRRKITGESRTPSTNIKTIRCLRHIIKILEVKGA